MNIRFANKDEITDWDKLILANPDNGNIFQGHFFAELKETAGWKPRYIVAENIAITVLEKNVLGLGKVWYTPKGPGVGSIADLQKLAKPLEEFAQKCGVFTIKIEPEIISSQETKGEITKLGLIKTRPVQQHFSTVILDISPSLPDVLKSLHQKGRYAIKRAERDGVTAKAVTATDENCRLMYELFKETATGAGFGIRPAHYYKAFWQGYEKLGIGQLFFAYHEDTLVAGAYILAYGKKGTYKDGASVRDRKAYGASHLLQWEAIKWLKKRSVSSYDLCGTPPSDQVSDINHPYHGHGQFKRSFNPEVTDYVGAFEIPVSPIKSKLWSKYLEKIVRRLYYKSHRESYY